MPSLLSVSCHPSLSVLPIILAVCSSFFIIPTLSHHLTSPHVCLVSLSCHSPISVYHSFCLLSFSYHVIFLVFLNRMYTSPSVSVSYVSLKRFIGACIRYILRTLVVAEHTLLSLKALIVCSCLTLLEFAVYVTTSMPSGHQIVAFNWWESVLKGW